MSKKYLSLILSLIMLFCSSNIIYAEDIFDEDELVQNQESDIVSSDDDEVIFEEDITDMEDEEIVDENATHLLSYQCPEEYDLLSKLHVFEENYNAYYEVDRGEFAAFLCRLLGIHTGEKVEFTDVTDNSRNKDAIGIIAGMGLMSGFGDGTFRAEEKVTYLQAASVFLKIAGYEQVANIKGGYPNGYLLLAGENDLIGGHRTDETLTWKGVSEMTYNALSIKVIGMSGFTAGDMVYEESDTLLLEQLFGLRKAKGTVVAGQYLALSGRKMTGDRYVVISDNYGDWEFYVGDTDIADYVGYKVTYYYNNEEETIVAYTLTENKMNVIEISEEDFVEVNDSFTELKYVIEGTNRVKNAKITAKADTVYNGVGYYGITKADFENADIIRLVDYDNDNHYDIVYITVYEYYLVDRVSLATNIISDKRDGIAVNVGDEDYDVEFIKGGMKTDISIIGEWDTLSVARTKADSSVKKLTVNISSDIIIGTVSGTSESTREVTIDKNTFYVSKKVDMTRLRGNVIVSINKYGAVVAFKRDTAGEKQYAYLMRVSRELGLNGYEMQMKIFDMDGVKKNVPIAEKFTLNGSRGKFEDLLALTMRQAYDPDIDGGFDVEDQIISFVMNEEGFVKKIFISDGVAHGAIEPTTADSLILNKKFTALRLWDNAFSINNEYIYTKDTVCFRFITDGSGKFIEELSGVFVPGKSKFISGSRPSVAVYDAGTQRQAGAIVVTIPIAEYTSYIDYDRQALIVDKVMTVCNEDGDIVKEVRGYQSGAEITYYAEENLSVDNWKKGDVYIIYKSKNNKIVAARKLFGMDDTSGDVLSPAKTYSDTYRAIRVFTSSTSSQNESNDWAEAVNASYGTIKEVIDNNNLRTIRIRPEGSNDDVIYTVQPSSKIYVYHTGERGKVDVTTYENLSVGLGSGKAMVYSRYGYARDIVIID